MAAILERQQVLHTIKDYYDSSSYLEGPLQGTCHFGFTPDGKAFDLNESLKAMEMLLGERLALPEGAAVLDAGSGYGRVATTLANEFGHNVIGLDYLGARLNEAQQFTRKNGVAGNVALVNGDYGMLPLKTGSLDGVYTMETLCHAWDLRKVQSEFMRALKPGGRVVHFEYSIPPLGQLDPASRWVAEKMIDRIGMPSLREFTHTAFPDIMSEAGFVNVTVQDISRNVWPTWKYLHDFVLNDPNIAERITQKDHNITNPAAALMIYPTRHWWGYKVITGEKPE